MMAAVSCNSFSEQESLREKVEAASAGNAALNSLPEKDFDALNRHLEKGESDWIQLVPALAKRTDSSYSEELTISLAKGLAVNPAAVLSILDENDSPVSIKRVCSIPFIEISDKKADAYVRNANASISKVTNPMLQGRKKSCLNVLNLPPGTPVE